jgi:hypothetical protein
METKEEQVFKPLKDWFNELPEPYRTKAIKNTKNLDITIDSIESGLLCAFMWSTTEEGYSYWNELFNKLK